VALSLGHCPSSSAWSMSSATRAGRPSSTAIWSPAPTAVLTSGGRAHSRPEEPGRDATRGAEPARWPRSRTSLMAGSADDRGRRGHSV